MNSHLNRCSVTLDHPLMLPMQSMKVQKDDHDRRPSNTMEMNWSYLLSTGLQMLLLVVIVIVSGTGLTTSQDNQKAIKNLKDAASNSGNDHTDLKSSLDITRSTLGAPDPDSTIVEQLKTQSTTMKTAMDTLLALTHDMKSASCTFTSPYQPAKDIQLEEFMTAMSRITPTAPPFAKPGGAACDTCDANSSPIWISGRMLCGLVEYWYSKNGENSTGLQALWTTHLKDEPLCQPASILEEVEQAHFKVCLPKFVYTFIITGVDGGSNSGDGFFNIGEGPCDFQSENQGIFFCMDGSGYTMDMLDQLYLPTLGGGRYALSPGTCCDPSDLTEGASCTKCQANYYTMNWGPDPNGFPLGVAVRRVAPRWRGCKSGAVCALPPAKTVLNPGTCCDPGAATVDKFSCAFCSVNTTFGVKYSSSKKPGDAAADKVSGDANVLSGSSCPALHEMCGGVNNAEIDNAPTAVYLNKGKAAQTTETATNQGTGDAMVTTPSSQQCSMATSIPSPDAIPANSKMNVVTNADVVVVTTQTECGAGPCAVSLNEGTAGLSACPVQD